MSRLLNPSRVTVEVVAPNTVIDPITREPVGGPSSVRRNPFQILAQVVWSNEGSEAFSVGGQSGLDPSSEGYLVAMRTQISVLGVKVGTKISKIAGRDYNLYINRITPIASVNGVPVFVILNFQSKQLRPTT